MPIATADALTGLGTPAQLAAVMGANPSALTCVGTTQSGAPIVRSRNTEFVTAGGATAAVLPVGAGIMEPYFVTNQATNNTALLFVPSGHTLNATANGSVAIAQAKSAIVWQYKFKNWCYVVLA